MKNRKQEILCLFKCRCCPRMGKGCYASPLGQFRDSSRNSLTAMHNTPFPCATRSKSDRVLNRYKIFSNENGHIVVETIGTFIPFILLAVSILSLVNIVTVQARIHYALTQTANSLSVYSYTLEVLGVANELTTLDNKAYRAGSELNAMKDDVNAVLTGIESLSDIGGAAESGGSIANRVAGWGGEAAEDPKALLELLMNYGVNELRNQAFEQIARPLVGKYLANGNATGDEYLANAGVVNRHTGQTGLGALEFYQHGSLGLGNSVLIDRNGNVKLTVEYEIHYTFGGLPLPFSPTLRVTQTAITKAWLNGSGKGYW